MIYSGIDKGIKLLYKYIIVLCIIFSSKDTWFTKNNNWFMVAGIVMTMILVLPLIIRKNMNLFQIRKVSVLILLVCISMVVNFDFRGYSMFVVLMIALLVTEIIDFEEFYVILENIILFMSILSIVGVFCRITYQSDFFPLFIQIAGNEALPWGFRLYGMFREPAMYCVYLGIALGRQLFFLETLAPIRTLVYLLAILLTGSATGYIAVLFAMTCFIIINWNKKRYYPVYIMGIAGGIMVCLRYGVWDYFLKRLSLHGASAYSSNSRYYSIIGGAFVGITHPFFGAGAVKSELRFEEFMDYLGKGAAWANMITYLWASFGCIFIYIFLKGIYNVAALRKKLIAFSFLIFIALLLCGETMTYSSIMYIFMLYGYSNRKMQGYFSNKLKRRHYAV
jgi:O-Antigen ligase.